MADDLASDLERWGRAAADVGFDGWLIADFRWNNPLFSRILGLSSGSLTRRAFLWIPAPGNGDPLVMTSRVDAHTVTGLSAPCAHYAGFAEMVAMLQDVLPSDGRIAMEYVERGTLPTVSRVDAGLVELLRSLDLRVASSGLLIASMEIWDERQRDLHRRAARGVDEARLAALTRCGELMRRGEHTTEGMLADVIQRSFGENGLSSGGRPDVGVGANSADPHYSIGPDGGAEITPDTVLLIDLWAKVRDAESAPFADSTWMAFTGTQPPPTVTDAFDAVRNAREVAIGAIDAAVESHRPITGAEVDRISRHVLEEAHFGAAIVHRTGHSLGIDHVHGMGTNLDDLEFPDERPLLVGSGVTIEPGVYFPGKFGMRSEVSAIVQPDGLEVTTEGQADLTLVSA